MTRIDSQTPASVRSALWAAAALTLTLSACPAFAALQSATAAKHGKAHAAVKGPVRSVDADGGIEHLRPGTQSSFAPALLDTTRFSFTPPGQTAATARMQTAEHAFRFTPSGSSDSRRSLSLGVNSRIVAATADTSRAAAPAQYAGPGPTAYNVDMSVGYRGFAVSGGYTRAENILLAGSVPTSLTAPMREAVDLGLSYRGKSWKTSVQLGSETIAAVVNGATLVQTPAERRYSVEVGGAYAVAPGIAVTGGLRYKLTPADGGLTDPQRNDRAVYLGTAFAF